jgi:hypothetical protein
VLVFVVLWLANVAVMAADGGLAIGFVSSNGRIERTLMTTLDQAPQPTRSTQARWSMQAEDDAGQLLWRWPLPAVRRFHPSSDGRSEFVLHLPAVAADTRLSLRDQHGRLLWSERLDPDALAVAQQRQLGLEARVREATAATHALAARGPNAALTRQLAGLDREHFSLATDATDLLEATLPASESPPVPAIEAVRNGPRSPDSVDLDAAGATDGTSIAGTVPVLVVGEDGQPPGVPFHAILYLAQNYIGRFEFDADGQAQLPLTSGGHYVLDFYPQAPLVAQRIYFIYSGEPLPAFELEIGWLLDIALRGADGQPLAGTHTASIWGQREGQGRQFPLSTTATPGLLRFALPKDAQWRHYLSADPEGDTYTALSQEIGALDGSQSRVLHLLAASPIPGLARAVDGAPLAGPGAFSCSNSVAIQGVYYNSQAAFAVDGAFVLHWPPGIASYCYGYAASPMLSTSFTRSFHAGEPIDVALLRGVPVRFRVLDEQGHAVADTPQGRWEDRASGADAGCAGNPCELMVPNDRAVAVQIRFAADGYAPIALPMQQYVANSEHVLTAQRRHAVGGQVVNADPSEEAYLRVRVYDTDDRFVVSSTGLSFNFRLPSGRYRFEADPNVPHSLQSTHWLYRPVASSGWVQLAGDTVLPDLVLPTARGALELVVDRPCGFEDRSVRVVHTAPDGRRVDLMRRQREEIPDLPRPPGQCASVHTLGLPPGEHAIDVAPLGWPLRRVNVSLQDGQTEQRALVFTAAERSEIWSGQLLDAQQQPLTQVGIFLDTAEQMTVTTAAINPQGQFELPFVPGWGAKVWVFDNDPSRALSKTIRFDTTPPGPILQLDRLAMTATPDSGLLRVYGDGDRRKRNIVFVAEGYADVAETYTDVNGNGRWDGVVWYDLNGSGLFEWNGDRLAFYGYVGIPEEGTVPTALNEPFVDLNGDGVLSVDDPGLFMENVRAFMHSLLGSDVWSEHRDHFNAWVLFAPSAQAGHDVRDAGGNVQLARDTRYGSYLDLNGSILGVDTTAMLQEVRIPA